MLQSNNWQELLNASEYKDQLIEMMKQYVLEFGFGILPRSPPFIITSREKEFFFLPAGNHVISGWNYKDADTRLDVAVVCKDTDALILMIWAYSKLSKTNKSNPLSWK